MTKVYIASRGFHRFLRLTLGNFLKIRFNLRSDTKDVDHLKPPYLVLANHTNFWDPFLVSTFLKEPVHYVTSDWWFRNPLLKILLHLVGGIPKTKFVSDLETVKSIIKIKKAHGVVGIFPEGRRTWNGNTVPLIYSTAKLVKTLGIPVVAVLLKGAYLSCPRWADRSRKGRIDISYKLLLNPREIAEMSVEEIYEQLKAGLDHNEYAWQEKNMVSFRGPRPAERLELMLFACPHCQTNGTMISKNNRFFCNKCNYAVSYNSYGYFEIDPLSSTPEKHFESPKQWNEWQLSFLEELINGSSETILQDERVVLSKGIGGENVKKNSEGRMILSGNGLEFIADSGDAIEFDLEGISGLNVQNRDVVEFYFQEVLYRFTFKSPHVSAYKWVKGIEFLIKKKTGKTILTE